MAKNNYMLSRYLRVYIDAETKKATSVQLSGYRAREDGTGTEYVNITVPLKSLDEKIQLTVLDDVPDKEAKAFLRIPFAGVDRITKKPYIPDKKD